MTQTLSPSSATRLWRIDIPVDIRKAFLQEGWPQSPRTYWLAVELDAEGGAFGWRTCQAPDRSGGDALWDVGDSLPRPWKQLPDSRNVPTYGPDTGAANMALSFTYSRARMPSEQRDDRLNLYEAVFLWIIRHSWSSAPYTYYLSLAGGDPPDDFLEDFPYFDVQPHSAMPPDELFLFPRRSLLLYVYPDTVTSIDENTVEIRGAYFCGSLCAYGYRYRLHWDGTAWQVVSETLIWIS